MALHVGIFDSSITCGVRKAPISANRTNGTMYLHPGKAECGSTGDPNWFPRELEDNNGDGGWCSPGGAAHPCKACQGDCDSDADCMGSLKCLQLSGAEPVPGCLDTGKAKGRQAGYDYCYDPSASAGDSQNCLSSKCCRK